MCGPFASYLPPAAIRALFGTTNVSPNHPPSRNVVPTQTAMVVRSHPDTGGRHLDLLQWGLVPHFTKDLKAERKPINTRSETAASSGVFRGALERRQCRSAGGCVLRVAGHARRQAALCHRAPSRRAFGVRRFVGRLTFIGRHHRSQLCYPDDSGECDDAGPA